MELGDLDGYARVLADPEVVRFIGDGTTADAAETAEWLTRSLHRNDHEGFDRRSVVRADDGSLLGWCGIAVWDIQGTIERELGYVLGREWWGRGLRDRGGGRDARPRTFGARPDAADRAHPPGQRGLQARGAQARHGYERQRSSTAASVELFALEV